jgi:hypothetical protein
MLKIFYKNLFCIILVLVINKTLSCVRRNLFYVDFPLYISPTRATYIFRLSSKFRFDRHKNVGYEFSLPTHFHVVPSYNNVRSFV